MKKATGKEHCKEQYKPWEVKSQMTTPQAAPASNKDGVHSYVS